MTTISERLRATGGKGQGGVTKAQAADIIDALVAALEAMVAERHEPSARAVERAHAALALAQK